MRPLDISAIQTSGQLFRKSTEVDTCEKLNQALHSSSKGQVGYSQEEWAALPQEEKARMEMAFAIGRNKTPQTI
jgi:hypothetical protein